MGNGVSFYDYEKMSDDLLYLGNGIMFRMNVSLAKKDKNGMRDHFHKEYKYSSKYPDKDKVITLRRSFDYYLSMDVKENYEKSIIIREKDIMVFQYRIPEVIKWFSELFKIKNKKLVIQGKYNSVTIPNLNNKTLQFDPTVISYPDGTYKEGIRFTFDPELSTDVDIDKFMHFTYLINTINLYQSASTMLNYLNNPALGSNIVSFDESYRSNPSNNEPEELDGKVKKTKQPTREKSFFDKMDDM